VGCILFNVFVVDDSNSTIIFMSRLLMNKYDCQAHIAQNDLGTLS